MRNAQHVKQREAVTTEKPIVRKSRPRCGKVSDDGAERPFAVHFAVNCPKMEVDDRNRTVAGRAGCEGKLR